MTPDQEPRIPESWRDPEFGAWPSKGAVSGVPAAGIVSASASRAGLGRNRGILRAFPLLVVLIWVGLFFDPMVGPLLRGAFAAVSMALGVLALAAVLGMLGMGLFAAGDRLRGWFHRGTRWPDE